MSKENPRWCFDASWLCHWRRKKCPLPSLWRALASLCLFLTIAFIVWSWTELRRASDLPSALIVCTTDSEGCELGNSDWPILRDNDAKNLLNELFADRKSQLREQCSRFNQTLQNDYATPQRQGQVNGAKYFRKFISASKPRLGSRRNWIFIKSNNNRNNFEKYHSSNSTQTDRSSVQEWVLEWCPIYKAASSPWMATFAKVANILTPHTEGLIRGGKLTFVKLFKDFRLNLPYASSKTPKNSFKMLIVRHPFARLLSAYRDKLERIKGREFYYRKYGYRILTQFRYAEQFNQLREAEGSSVDTFRTMLSKILEIRNGVGILGPKVNRSVARLFKQKILPSTALERPTFHEFVQYLLRADPRSMDEHWRPMYLDCDPCKYEFDLILHVETMEKDRSAVLKLLGLLPNSSDFSESLESVWRRWTNAGQSSALKLQNSSIFPGESQLSPLEASYFSQIPKSDLILLHLKYEPDFLLFNYSAEPYLSLMGK